ncbi:FecR domain-containing protein [Labrenzia sp. CE80]|uniref:FecR family protein n=1 Tax=Labrenzia sp. CE80 TaxID=1788986 RepID=UPI00138988A5|nr:FecR domain-containing protein [Labrenzia sp. CE80]
MTTHRDALEAEAADWVVRLGAQDASEGDHAAFEDWISQGPLYEEAFDRASQAWADFGRLTREDLVAEGDAAPNKRSVRAFGTPKALFSKLDNGFTRFALTASLMMFIAYGAISFWVGDPIIALQADYRAETGAMRTVVLPDGSQVDLASGGAIAVDYSTMSRQVRLLSGKAYFIVAPQDDTTEVRPFSVNAGTLTMTALGTEFMVDFDEVEVEMLVTEHNILVEEQQGASLQLSEGEALTYRTGQGFSDVREETDKFAMAWRKGLLIFNDRRLKEVVEEINRYRRGKIVIRSNRMAELHVSGVFDANDIDNAVDRIAGELNLGVISIPPVVSVLY